MTPGKTLANSLVTSSVSFSLVSPRGHSSKGFSGAKSSMLLKPATSVPSSGRPSCETTDTTSGWFLRMLRMRPTCVADSDKEIDIGKVARIQKLPSSSLGMNSPPRSGKSTAHSPTGTSSNNSAILGLRRAWSKSGL